MALRVCLGVFLILFAFGADGNQAGGRVCIQGPWYTVGWKMSVVIEKTFGRAKLIECFCDQRKLLPTYNEAAAKHNSSSPKPLPLWSGSIVDALRG